MFVKTSKTFKWNSPPLCKEKTGHYAISKARIFNILVYSIQYEAVKQTNWLFSSLIIAKVEVLIHNEQILLEVLIKTHHITRDGTTFVVNRKRNMLVLLAITHNRCEYFRVIA